MQAKKLAEALSALRSELVTESALDAAHSSIIKLHELCMSSGAVLRLCLKPTSRLQAGPSCATTAALALDVVRTHHFCVWHPRNSSIAKLGLHVLLWQHSSTLHRALHVPLLVLLQHRMRIRAIMAPQSSSLEHLQRQHCKHC